MNYRKLKWVAIILPTLLIGGFEFIRHTEAFSSFSMQAGNVIITVMTLILSYLFANWMFAMIERQNSRIVEEQARRARLEERERLARELHDNIAQMLFFLNVKLRKGHWEEAKKAVQEIENDLRQAIFNLRTEPEKTGNLTERMKQWLEDWQSITGIETEVHMEVPPGHFSQAQEVLLFAIFQEAFTNIRKHSSATNVWFHFTADADGWEMTVRDNGVGIQSFESQTKRYGLRMMKERAEQLGATWSIEPAANSGTLVRVKG